MRKIFLFIMSLTFALGITIYLRQEQSSKMVNVQPQWKTFVKNPQLEIVAHQTTNEELEAAKIPPPPPINIPKNSPVRSTASVDPYKGFMIRKNRILTGEVDQKYEDENNDLKMVNTINPKWKDIMGNDLMRFQPQDTKLMVKEEVPVIKIQDGLGRYLEQVSITYLKKDGDRHSFKALIDSDTGMVVETWDRTIHEKLKAPREGFILPSINESGIVTR